MGISLYLVKLQRSITKLLNKKLKIQWCYSPRGLWLAERPPSVSEASANFCRQRGVTWSAQRIPTAVNLCLSNLDHYLFYSSSSSIDLTRLSVPCSRPTATQKIWQRRESNPRPLYLQPETLTTRPQRRSHIGKSELNIPLKKYHKSLITVQTSAQYVVKYNLYMVSPIQIVEQA